MDKKMEQALVEAAQMHFKMFNEFLKLTGGDIGLSLRLTSSWTAAMIKPSDDGKEKEKQLWEMLGNGNGILN